MVEAETSDMAEESLYKIALQVEGAEKAKKLAADVAAAEKQLKALIAANGGVGSSAAQMNSAVAAQAASLKGLTDQLKTAQRELNSIGSAAGFNANKMQVFAQSLDDLQYVPEQGLRPILNNLVQISPILGIVAIAGQTLFSNWDTLAKLWGAGHTKTEAEKMEALGKQTEKTAAETEKLQKYEEMRRRGKAQSDKPDEIKKVETAIDKAFSEGPIDAINKGLDKNFSKKIQTDAEVSNPEVFKELEAAKKQLADDTRINKEQGLGEDDPYLAIARDRVSKAQDGANAAYAESRTKFSTDDIHRKEILKAAQANPQDFGTKGKDFAKNLERAMDPRIAEEEAYEEWRLAQEEQFQSKLAAMQNEAAAKELEDDRKYDEWRIKQEEDFQSKLAKAQEDSLNDQAKNAAGDFLQGKKGDRFLKGNATEEDLTAEMRRWDMDDGDEVLRTRIKNEIETRANAMGADEATKRGLAGPDQGRDRLASDLAIKQFDDAKAERDKKAGRVKEAIPEIGNLLTDSITGAVKSGQGTIAQAQNALFGKLADRFGVEAATSLLEESGKQAESGLINDAVNGQQDLGPVQILNGASSLRDSIQGSVRENTELKKLAEKTDRTNAILSEILQTGGGLA